MAHAELEIAPRWRRFNDAFDIRLARPTFSQGSGDPFRRTAAVAAKALARAVRPPRGLLAAKACHHAVCLIVCPTLEPGPEDLRQGLA